MPPKQQPRSSTKRTTRTKRPRFISNHQVARLLQQQQQQQSASSLTTPTRRPKNATWIRERVLWYFETGAPRSSVIESFSDARLSREECWQVTNTAPTELVELHLIIANINDRFTEAEQTALLETIVQQQEKTAQETNSCTTNEPAAAVTPPDGGAKMEED